MNPDIFDFTVENGLVYCDKPETAKNNAERLYLHEIKGLNPHAVFFRRFYKDNETNEKDKKSPYHSEPAVCIFERDESFFIKEDDPIKLHAAIWSSGKNEVYVIRSQTRIDIINARTPAKQDNNKLVVECLETIQNKDAITYNSVKQRFSAFVFGTGTFWDQDNYKYKLQEGSNPHIFLMNHLMETRNVLRENLKGTLGIKTVDTLLLTCILVKILEGIKDDEGRHTLKEIYKKHGVVDFADAISKKLSISILDDLKPEFNGKIFDKFSEEEKKKINNTDLKILAEFFESDINIKTKQKFIWKQYDFRFLPAEVISSIYENFIQEEARLEAGKEEKGIVYTPIHLVNFLIDEVMPLEAYKQFEQGDYKVLDPACGSGVFLVAAYKRLLQWWVLNNRDATNKIEYPTSEQALAILENNIFGVDVKDTAILVSIFGFTSALLDILTPKEIWGKLKFKDLKQKNLFVASFFEWAVAAKKEGRRFSLVVGNPPFNPETGKKKNEVLIPKILNQLDFKHKPKSIPNGNFALHFFEAAMTFTQKLCLIIPANAILYNKAAQDYRSKVFTDFTVSKIFDFTHLRRVLFHHTADTPVVALVVENKPSDWQTIELLDL